MPPKKFVFSAKIRNFIDGIISAAVGLHLGLDHLAPNADHLGVLAGVGAEGDQGAEPTSEEEQSHTPDDCDAADFLSGHVSGVPGAGGAGGSAAIASSSTD